MKLEELLKDIKINFMICEYLKAYLYEDKIEIIEYTPEIELDNGYKLDAFYGVIATIWLEDNIIDTIEDKSMHIVTKANKDAFIYLANLINVEIEDYDKYDKLSNRKDLKCITL